MRKRCSRLPPSSSRQRDGLSLSPGGDRLFVGCRYRWEILIAFDGFFAAELTAGENKDNGNRGDHAAHDNAECPGAIVFHDFHPTSAAARCSDAACARNPQKSLQKFGHL